MNHLDVGIAYASASRLLTTDNIKADGRLFALAYRDGRPLPKVDNRPASARLRDSSAVKLLTVGGHLAAVRDFAGGQADVLLWGAWQTGEWGALDHNASAFGLEAGAQWKVPHLDPWLRAGYWRSSGDEDAEDAEHGTFFQVLPTPRVYARFPFYNLMNSEDIFAELVLRPSADWTIRSDAHVLKLTSAGDSWYAGGGAFEDGTFGYSARTAGARVLARVIDTSIEYRATPPARLHCLHRARQSRSRARVELSRNCCRPVRLPRGPLAALTPRSADFCGTAATRRKGWCRKALLVHASRARID